MNGNQETFPEFSKKSSQNATLTPDCSTFDSSYQNVSMMYLNWLYMNMPSGGIVSASDNVRLSTSETFVAAIQGMNKELANAEIVVNSNLRAPVSSWCYGAGGSFAQGEISECHNSRVGGNACVCNGTVCPAGNEYWFDSISAMTAFQEFGVLANETAPGNTAPINYADQISRWYTTNFVQSPNPVCADRFQAFYI